MSCAGAILLVGCLLPTSLSFAPTGYDRAFQTGADSVAVQLRQTTWMQLSLEIDYSHLASPDSATVTVRWYKKNGSALPFTPALARVAPGRGRIALDAHYRGVLGPPVLIRMRTVMQAGGGRVLARQECALTLVTAQGRTAWAGDLRTSRRAGLRWRSGRCVAR